MGTKVKIHQIVLLNISNHLRSFSTQQNNTPRVVGILFGIQEGYVTNVLGSFEAHLRISTQNQEIETFNYDYVNNKIQLLRENNCYKDCELVGWYSTVPNMKPLERDLEIHKGFFSLDVYPIYLCFDPNKDAQSEMPIRVYTYRMSFGREYFRDLTYAIEVEKTEMISLEHLANNLTNTYNSQLADSMSINVNAVRTMGDKLKVLIDKIEKNPRLQEDDDLMREIKEFCLNIPDKLKNSYREDLIKEYNEASLLNMLSGLLVANKTIQDVIHLRPRFDIKMDKVYEDQI